jgi:hypothetical protein
MTTPKEIEMAAKTKAKTAKPTAKKATKRTSKKPRVKGQSIPNHRFAPGTKVGVYPAHEVTVERGMGREPIASPTATATVKDDGTLEVSGLKAGAYLAAAEIKVDGEPRYRYVQFSVKSKA